jgi:hypothetical protein
LTTLRQKIALVAALVGWRCTFPEITIVESTSAASTSSASAGGAGGTSSSGGSGGDPCAVADADGDDEPSPACGGQDCNDEDDRVHPGQTSYFGTAMMGAPPPGGPFDFDCSGMADPDPMQVFTSCSMPLCNGEGYQTDTATCGNVNGWVMCSLLMSLCQASPATAAEPLRCH